MSYTISTESVNQMSPSLVVTPIPEVEYFGIIQSFYLSTLPLDILHLDIVCSS